MIIKSVSMRIRSLKIVFIKTLYQTNWLNSYLNLSFLCWPKLSVGFDRPWRIAYLIHTFSSVDLCAKPSCSPFAVEREGDASCVLVLYAQSVNPLFVLPPSFDSDLVEPLFAYRNLSCLIHLFSSVFRHMFNLVISVNGE